MFGIRCLSEASDEQPHCGAGHCSITQAYTSPFENRLEIPVSPMAIPLFCSGALPITCDLLAMEGGPAVNLICRVKNCALTRGEEYLSEAHR